MLAAADAGADDVELDGSSFVITGPRGAERGPRGGRGRGLRGRVGGARDDPEGDGGDRDEATARKILRLVEGLEEADDVQDVYANFDIPETVLEAVAS